MKYLILPPCSPTTRSKSPSLSKSVKVGLALNPTSIELKGFAVPVNTINVGCVLLPVFSKYLILPSPLPTTRSTSPSLSKSVKVGALFESTTILLKGFAVLVLSIKVEIVTEPVFSK